MNSMGYWREPEGTPSGKLTWLPPPKTGGLPTHVGLIDGKQVATIRNKGRGLGFTAQITGWVWYPRPEAPDGRMGVKESPVIAFTGLKDAKQAVADAMALLPATATH